MCIDCFNDSQQDGVQLDSITVFGTPEELNTVVEALEALDKVDEPSSIGEYVDLDEPCGPDCTCFEVEPTDDVILSFDGEDFIYDDLDSFEQAIWHAAYSTGVRDGLEVVENIVGLAVENSAPDEKSAVEALSDFVVTELDDLEESLCAAISHLTDEVVVESLFVAERLTDLEQQVAQILEGVDARLDAQQLEITDLSGRVSTVEGSAVVVWGNKLIGDIASRR